MCGICGIVEFDGGAVEPETIHRMANTLRHRGPDDLGYYFEPSAGLGHCRLSIIDRSSGRQPLSNEDESVWIVFNGEIYNYLDLRSVLEARGHKFRTKSDTEVIVHLYEDLGEDCFAQLRGMFAIAIWDCRRRQVVLARDRIGKKPLFYHHEGSRLIFGSELKAVTAGNSVSAGLSPTALADYFAFFYIPAPGSIYQGTSKVPAAHYIVFSKAGARQEAYWDLRFSEVEHRSEAAWCEGIRESLLEAVQVRLMSEVPLGSFLSGGVDSSAVVACMAQLMDLPVTACAVGFDEQPYNEIQYAQAVAQHLGVDCQPTMVRPDAAEAVERLVWHYDEPFADSSAIATYYVSKAAREQVTVALSGDGGDESFAGYRRYAYDNDDNRLRSMVPATFRRGLFRPLGKWYPELEGAPKLFRGKHLFERLGQDPLEGYLARISLPKYARERLLSDDLKNELQGYDPLDRFRAYYHRAQTDDLLSRIQYLDIKTYLTDDICVKVDRASMAVSLEVRCPLLDHRFMELAARIPSALKLKTGRGKYIFKRAIHDMFPRGFLERPKMGFGVPVAEWLRGELREWAQEILFAPDDLLNLSHVRWLWNRHQNHVQDHSAILWAVFMFRQWQRAFQRQSTVLSQPISSLHAGDCSVGRARGMQAFADRAT